MVFSSAIFLSLFLPITLTLYFFAQEKLRNYVLLAASLFFYAWGEPKAVLVMCALILITYFLAIGIEKCDKCIRKMFFILALCLNLGALICYKYWMFFLHNWNFVLENLNFSPVKVPEIALPIGISFYVFQIISYVADVYKGEVKAQSNLTSLATYVSLFPQLVAGPIVRYKTIEEDLHNRAANFENVFLGLRRFAIGLAKKVLIADQMAVIADAVFDAQSATVPSILVWSGAIAYTLQIFYDFSGYSDMAIGLGRIFNFRFLENFNYPYCSLSIKEFWRRWHISLSSWFRDYLYIPLGGNRKGKLRTYINMYIVFGLCGLWHGATWNFVFWGVYHGTGLVVERLFLGTLLEKISCKRFFRIPFGKVLLNIYTLLFVIVGWVFFRSTDLSEAFSFLKIMFCGNSSAPLNSFYDAAKLLTYTNLWAMLVGIVCSYPIFTGKYEKFRYSKTETCLVLVLFIVTYVFAMTSTFSPFIYFRF